MLEWRDICDGKYEANNLGQVRHKKSLRLRKLYKNRLRTSKGTINVSRKICKAWHGEPPTDKHQAAHWDGNCENNAPGNLRWATQAENEQDKLRHGTYWTRRDGGKLTQEDADNIRVLLRGVPWSANGRKQAKTVNAIQEQYGITKGTISYLLNGKTWRHAGEIPV